MYCNSCGAAVVGKYCSCCGERVERKADAQRPYMPIEMFGRAIDLMCRYGISVDTLAKHIGSTKETVFSIIGRGAFSEDAVRLCASLGELVIPLAMKRNAEADVIACQIRAEIATHKN